MSRVVSAAVFLLALSISLPAQRGGMRAGGGARMAMGRSAAPMGFARAPQMRPQVFAPRPTTGFARPQSFVRPRPAFVPRQRSFFITTGHTNGGPFIFTPGFGQFRHHFHHHHAFFYALPYYGTYWPSYYGDSWNPNYSFGSYSYDPTANTSYYTDLSNQMNQLSSEVQQLQDDNDSLRSSLYGQQRPPAAPVATATIGSTSGNEPPTVLVYRDGHRSEVLNYAIVGSTLWSLSPSRATKVPLADLNLDQTVKVNEDRGISFQIPK